MLRIRFGTENRKRPAQAGIGVGQSTRLLMGPHYQESCHPLSIAHPGA